MRKNSNYYGSMQLVLQPEKYRVLSNYNPKMLLKFYDK